jgi:hypothetical protein
LPNLPDILDDSWSTSLPANKKQRANTRKEGTVPTGVRHSSYHEFINRPAKDKSCNSVDKENGMYYECSICNECVKGHHGWHYGVGWWKEHVQHNARHLQCLKKTEQEEVLSLKAKGNRTKLEQLFLDSQKKMPTKSSATSPNFHPNREMP